MIEEQRIVDSEKLADDFKENKLRPLSLNEFIGQEKLKDNLDVYIKAAQGRQECIEHLIFYGPPGLGKTTLAAIIAKEMNVNLKVTSGPAIERPGDLASLLTNLNENDVLFIDEIHRLNRSVEEVLYPAMEDNKLDIMIGKGPSARSVRLDLPPFTLVAATTRMGAISSPLRDRFGIVERLEFYSPNELSDVIERSANILDVKIDKDACDEISRRSRGTPRIANRLIKRIRDWAEIENNRVINIEIVNKALTKLGIDDIGLDSLDRHYLENLIKKFKGGPVGIETLAYSISEEVTSLEEVCEPFLLQKGFIQRTPRGRIATDASYKHLNLKPQKKVAANQQELF